MGIATGMKELTRDIASSHRARTRRLGEIRKQANEARGEAMSLIMGFEAYRQETSRQLRRDLAQDKVSRKSEVTGMLKGFERTRREEGAQMSKELTQGVAERRSEVNGMLADAQQTINSFRSHRKQMSTQLRRDLVKDTARRNSEVKKMRGHFQKAQAEVRDDLREARTTWQGLTSTMPAKRSRAEIPQKAETLAVEETIDLEAKMLAVVNEHPEGMTLSGIADIIGVAPVVLGRTIKSLVDKAEIRKEEKLYFPRAIK
jgi:YesN/AraC family two-component response regulator